MKIIFVDGVLPKTIDEMELLLSTIKHFIRQEGVIDLRLLDAGRGISSVRAELNTLIDTSRASAIDSCIVVTNCLEVLDLSKQYCEEKDMFIQSRTGDDIYSLVECVGNWCLKSVSISKMYLDGKFDLVEKV